MRQQPVVLVSRDPALISEVRQVALQAACPLEISHEVTAEHRAAASTRRLLLGGDLGADPSLRDTGSLVVMLRHHGEPETDRALMLPDARSWLVDRLREMSPTPARPLAPAVAVLGASGGIGTSSLAVGLATALASSSPDKAVTLLDLDPVLGDGPGGQDSSWLDGRVRYDSCPRPADVEARLRSACDRSAAVVVDAPRWAVQYAAWFDAAVVVLANRVHSVAAAARLVATIRESGLQPSFVLATGAGGLWPADVERALGVSTCAAWPADRGVARAADGGDLVRTLARGKWRRTCLKVAEAALSGVSSGRAAS